MVFFFFNYCCSPLNSNTSPLVVGWLKMRKFEINFVNCKFLRWENKYPDHVIMTNNDLRLVWPQIGVCILGLHKSYYRVPISMLLMDTISLAISSITFIFPHWSLSREDSEGAQLLKKCPKFSYEKASLIFWLSDSPANADMWTVYGGIFIMKAGK